MSVRLPDLVVVGAPRSGTTTLSRWLRAHPEVAFSQRKELEFFDRHFDRGLDWYGSQFPADAGARLLAEATPTYLSDRFASERIAASLPDTRFVAILREPVARAWSNYWFFCQLGLERRPWGRALAEESPLDALGYLWRGRYAEQLARWEASIDSYRLHVVLLDDLIADPEAAYAGICSFAGITPIAPPSTGSVNPASRPRSRRLQSLLHSPSAGPLRRAAFQWNAHGRSLLPMPTGERERLMEEFRIENLALATRLGRDLPTGWLAPGRTRSLSLV